MTAHWPLIVSACADCGLGTVRLGEWYMVRDDVWEQAWRGRRKPWQVLPGQQVLCISCLEKRLGRTLMACDFTDASVNDPNKGNISQRMGARLTSTEPPPASGGKRRRGRPKGSKNKPKRRRPKGSKNRPKAEPARDEIAAAITEMLRASSRDD
jgi:hypothetical protein